jgi:ATP-dependent RNA helicase DeaD
MAERFEELGIAPGVAAGAEAAGWVEPTALQRDALPILRRGNNAVLHAASGAGATGAYGLGILDRLASTERTGDGYRALILVPGAETASRVARCLASLATGSGITVRALAPGWPRRSADVLVAPADAAVEALRNSSLKVEALLALVVHGAEQLSGTQQWSAVETVVEAAPSGAQRIVVSGRTDASLDNFVERHVRKSMTIPPRPVEVITRLEPGAAVEYLLGPESEKDAATVSLIEAADSVEVAVICRTAARAERLSAELLARGLAPDGGAGEVGVTGPRLLVLARSAADQRSTRATVISYDVPPDAESFEALHARGGTVLVTPGQLVHLQHLAERTGASLRRVPPGPRPRMGPAERVRARLRETLQNADLAADLALIEPLLEEFSAPELAAAALHIARAGGAGGAGGADAGAHAAADAPVRDPGSRQAAAASSAPPPGDTWVRLFISAGTRDGLGPGDLVGAIAGETALEGGQVGKIEVRESHSTVEVPADSAAAVIQALNGRSLRGRSLRVDYDRKERSPGRPPPRGGPRSGGSGGARGGAPRAGGPPRGGPGGRRPRPGGSGGSRS